MRRYRFTGTYENDEGEMNIVPLRRLFPRRERNRKGTQIFTKRANAISRGIKRSA